MNYLKIQEASMRRRLAHIILVFIVGMLPAMGSLADSLPRDVVLVLDNSGSMKKNDPDFLTVQAVSGMINNFTGDTRASIIIFDQEVDLAVELTVVDDTSRSTILDSLKGINYRGKYTDSPAAVERAIYELKKNGRNDARKIVVFMTDGIVDTGKQEMDALRTEWLREELAEDAAENKILIYSVAFTSNADLLMISTLARKTHAEYFRAEQADELESVFLKINELIYKPEPVKAPPPPPPPVVVAPPPVVVEEPVQPPVVEPQPAPPVVVAPPPAPAPTTTTVEPADDSQMLMLMGVIGIIIVAAGVVIMMVLRRRGSAPQSNEQNDYVPQAFLNDINDLTDKPSYEIGKKATMIGRVAGSDADNLNYIVVPQTTVGRRHALIEYKDFAYWIIDQDSVNGTFVNDEKITEPHRLKHGDRVRLHKNEFEFVMPEMFDTGMTVFSNADTNAPASNPELDKMFGVESAETQSSDIDVTGPVGVDAEPSGSKQSAVSFSEDITTPPEITNSDLGSEDETVARPMQDEGHDSEAPTEFNLSESDEGNNEEISFDDFMDTMAIKEPVVQMSPADAEDDEDDDDDATVLMLQETEHSEPEELSSEDVTVTADAEKEKIYDETMIFEGEPETSAEPEPSAVPEQVYAETMIFEGEPEPAPEPEKTYAETMIFEGEPEPVSAPEPTAKPENRYDETLIFVEEPEEEEQQVYAETMIFEGDQEVVAAEEKNYDATMIFEADSEVDKQEPPVNEETNEETEDELSDDFNFDESLIFDPDEMDAASAQNDEDKKKN